MTTGTVKVGDTVTGTNTTQSYNYTQVKIEYGWECPRCGHINAPWVRQCDCQRNYQSNTITWTTGTSTPNDDWQKTYINCQTDDITKNTTYQVGGSDYKVNGAYVNVGGTQSNKVEPNVTAWNCTNPNNCHTPNYTTETMVNNDLEPLIRHFKD